MKIFFDHNVDRRFARRLVGHDVKTARQLRLDALANGLLLRAAAQAGFDVFLTIDKKIEYEQNLRTLPLAVVILDSPSNALPMLTPFVEPLLLLFSSPLERGLFVIQADGATLRLQSPR